MTLLISEAAERDLARQVLNLMMTGEWCVLVEDVESGEMADGTPWPVQGLCEGRFANVF